MPTVLRNSGYRFHFYSHEGNEPPHIHVERGDCEAKFWLIPDVHVAYNDGYNSRTLRELEAMVRVNRDRIERAWNEFFS